MSPEWSQQEAAKRGNTSPDSPGKKRQREVFFFFLKLIFIGV